MKASMYKYLSSILFLILISVPVYRAQNIDGELLHGLKTRSIGPAGMSGRVTAIDVVLINTDIIYVGTASGGLWRSTNGGIKWEPLFDEQSAASIGAVAVDQNIPDVIWVGTGEGNPRNSQTSGNGVYRSLDGGKTWNCMGLEKTRNIHRIKIDPRNSNVVYVGAQGSAWGESEERGVFKTTDGGKTWKKILYLDKSTGVADLILDPSNPNKLIAAMWQFRRWPWFFKSGGPGSGIFISFDGGDTWQRRTVKDGLLKGDLGRIGLAVSPSKPNIIYSLVEAGKNALYKSTDGGFKWNKVSDKNIGDRPFYYAEIYVDPKNENRIYNLYSVVDISEDGGRTFENLVPWTKVHPDHHAFWISPIDPDFLINGNDGGLAISRDRGKTWRFIENLPLAQFYHIDFDMESPYNVYGGMQDNGSWRGPSRVQRYGGIRNSYWEEVGFGDGFDVVPDRSNNRFGYGMSQGGNLFRFDLLTGDQESIKPTHPEGFPLRFNWNAAIAHDNFSNTTIYYGSQFLHKSSDRGNTWEIISPDLTTNDTSKQHQFNSGGLTYDVTNAENFTTIVSIAPSPVKDGTIWVGTDDGNLQLTTDGGKNWQNVIGNIKGVPAGCWIPHIRASSYDEKSAFVVINDYRRDNWTPFVFYTPDLGKSWKRLVNEKDIDGYCLSFIQDPVEPSLMFVGTEFGLYFSIDNGANWTKWKKDFPTVSTIDLQIHPRENDLIIATFGRAAYIVDNIQPLRELAADKKIAAEIPVKLFPIPNAEMEVVRQASGTRFIAEADFAGENRPYGAMISYYLNPDSSKSGNDQSSIDNKKELTNSFTDSVYIRIIDNKNDTVRTIQLSPKKGLNRYYWDLDSKGIRFPGSSKPKDKAAERGGGYLLPGNYKVVMSHGKFKDSTTVAVKIDSRINVNIYDLNTRQDMIREFSVKIEKATKMFDNIMEAKKSVELVNDRIGDHSDFKELKKKGKDLLDSLKTLEELVVDKEVQGIRDNPELLGNKLRRAYRSLAGSWQPVGQREENYLAQAKSALDITLPKIQAFFESEWETYQNDVEKAKISFFEMQED